MRSTSRALYAAQQGRWDEVERVASRYKALAAEDRPGLNADPEMQEWVDVGVQGILRVTDRPDT